LQVVVLPLVPVTRTISISLAGTERILREIFMATVPGRAVPPRPVFRRTVRIILQDAMDSIV
jgi:hypothetical protein